MHPTIAEQLANVIHGDRLALYPDVFGGRVEDARLEPTLGALLRALRDEALPIAGIGAATPIRTCESGWRPGPTGPKSAKPRCSTACCAPCNALRRELSITHWELFALREADSSRDDRSTASASSGTTTRRSPPSTGFAERSRSFGIA